MKKIHFKQKQYKAEKQSQSAGLLRGICRHGLEGYIPKHTQTWTQVVQGNLIPCFDQQEHQFNACLRVKMQYIPLMRITQQSTFPKILGLCALTRSPPDCQLNPNDTQTFYAVFSFLCVYLAKKGITTQYKKIKNI